MSSKQDIELEVVPVRKMTKEESKSFVGILFNMFMRDLIKIREEKQMQFSIRFDPQYNCIITKFTGTLDNATVQKCADEIQKLSAENNCKCLLLDIRQAKVQNNVLDYYRLPKKLYDLGVTKNWKRAVLVSKKQDGKDIFETEFVGKGLKVQICSNEKVAFGWLCS